MRTVESTRNDRVIRLQRDRTRHGWLTLDRSFEGDERRFCACDLTPVNAQEDTLFGGTGGN